MVKIESPFNIGGNSTADGNGNCSAPWVSPALFHNKYILASNNDWVAIAAEAPLTIEVVNASTGVVITSFTLVGSSSFNLYYGYMTTNISEGTIIRAQNPGELFGLWYQPASTTTYSVQQDETLSFGWE